MSRLRFGLLFVLITVLSLFSAGRAKSQSNVLSDEQRFLFSNLDPVLYGYWEGHPITRDGMKYDPQAIACMVRRCDAVRSAFAECKKTRCEPVPWRDSSYFKVCYDAHLQRVRSPGYQRMSDPPTLSSLTCTLIDSQHKSSNDRVFEAVNGHPRPRPTVELNQVSPSASPRSTLSRAESDYLLAQLDSATRTAKSDDNPYVDAPKPAYRGHGPSGLGDDLVLLYANAREAAIYVKPGGQFYTIRASYLAKKYETDWEAVYVYAGNENQDMFGACFHGARVQLDADRMRVKSYDTAKLQGPVNPAFKERCQSDGGEFRFALQAGQIIKIPAKGTTGTGASASGSPPAPKVVAPIVPTVPAPSVTAAPTTSPEDSSVAAPAPFTTGYEPADSAAPVEDASTNVQAPIVPEAGAAEPDAEVRQDAGVPVSQQPSSPHDWDWLAHLLLVVLGIALVVMVALGIRNRLRNQSGPDPSSPDSMSGSDPPPPPSSGGDDDDDDDDDDPAASAPGPAPPASGGAPPTGGLGPPGASAGTYGPPQPGPDPRRTRKFSFPANPNVAAPPVDPDQQSGIFTPPRRDHVKTPKRSVQFPNYGADPEAATVQYQLPASQPEPDPYPNVPPDDKSGGKS